jgi:heptosyltransferase III
MRKILVLRGGALGDFVVTLPAIAALKQRWPGAEIELVGNETAAAIGVREGLLVRVYSQHEAKWGALYGRDPLSETLAAWFGSFDLVVSYWPDPDGTLAEKFPIHRGQEFITAEAMPTCAPAAAHYGAPLRRLGIELTSPVYRFHPALYPTTKATEKLRDRTRTIAVHPGSGSMRKNWPKGNWEDLIRRIAQPVLIITGEAEPATWPDSPQTRFNSDVQTARNLPLPELIGELCQCRLFLGHDSGIGHLAAACGIPCVLLFGPTDPAIWAPPASGVKVIRHGPDLRAITVDEVLSTVGECTRDRALSGLSVRPPPRESS